MSDTTAAPAYQQVKSAVRSHIEQGRLKPGDRLPTEAQLCAELGFSRPTVNRALNELQWEGVVERVQGSGTFVAESQPRNRRWRVVVSGWVQKASASGDPYWGALFSGIRDEAATQAVDISYWCEAAVPSMEVLNEPPGADGVLSMAYHLDDVARLVRLHQAGVRVLGVAVRPRSYPVPAVCIDNFGGVCEVVRRLTNLGHRRIAFASPYVSSSDVTERLLGFHHAMAQAGLPVDPSCLLLTDEVCDGMPLEDWWDSLGERPTALIVANYLLGRVLRMLDREGIRVPDDVSVVVTDHWPGLHHTLALPTAIRQPAYELGRRAMGKLIDMMRGEDDGKVEVLPAEFIPGSTVAPPGTRFA